MMRLVLSIFMLTFGCYVNAGNSFGNGGDVVICQLPNGEETVELLDYVEYEIVTDTKLSTELSGTDIEIALKLILPLEEAAPIRFQFYRKLIRRFYEESVFVQGEPIPNIDDEGAIILPSRCRKIQAITQTPGPDRYARVSSIKKGRYTIQKEIWERLTNRAKAGLIVHEILYREIYSRSLSAKYPATSQSVRIINGFLAGRYPGVIAQSEWNELLQNVGISLLDYSVVTSRNSVHLLLDTKTDLLRFHESGVLKSIYPRERQTPILVNGILTEFVIPGLCAGMDSKNLANPNIFNEAGDLICFQSRPGYPKPKFPIKEGRIN